MELDRLSRRGRLRAGQPLEWRRGYCARTSSDAPSDCNAGSLGSWDVPKATTSWDDASAACTARCRACSRCAVISLSLKHRDCSWYAWCNTSRLFRDVKAVFTSRVRDDMPRVPRADTAAVRRRPHERDAREYLSHPYATTEGLEYPGLSSASPYRLAFLPQPPGSPCAGAAASLAASHRRRQTRRRTTRTPAPSCASGAPAAGSVLLLAIGVVSAPPNARLREAARRSWMHGLPHGAGRRASALACFSIGVDRATASPAILEESEEHRDVLLVGGRSGSAYEAAFGWWRAAATLFRAARYIAKADDDSVVDVAELTAQLLLLRTCPHTNSSSRSVYMGHFYYAGFNPSTQSICTWTRQWQPAEYEAWRCHERGAFPPVPCAIGALELVSSDLAQWLGASPAVRRAMEHAVSLEVPTGAAVKAAGEDTILGYWVSRSPQRREVMYIRLGWQLVHDVKCAPEDKVIFPSRVPTAASAGVNPNAGRSGSEDRDHEVPSMVVHKVKSPEAMRYVWAVLRGAAALNATRCRHALAGDELTA